MRRKVIWMIVLAVLCLLVGCSITPGPTGQVGPETATITYVPLDDRPVNATRAVLLAQSAGF